MRAIKMILGAGVGVLIASISAQAAFAEEAKSSQGIESMSAGEISSVAFSKFDQNEDGKVTRSEGHIALSKQFAAVDRNGNGQVSQTEILSATREGVSKQKPGQGQEAELSPKVEQRIEFAFRLADSDNSETVSKREVTKKFDQLFTFLDRDQNGALEQAEIDVTAQAESEREPQTGREVEGAPESQREPQAGSEAESQAEKVKGTAEGKAEEVKAEGEQKAEEVKAEGEQKAEEVKGQGKQKAEEVKGQGE